MTKRRSLRKQLLALEQEYSEATFQALLAHCLAHPEQLDDLVAGLHSDHPATIHLGTQILAQVAQHHPEEVAPYTEFLTGLLSNPYPHICVEALRTLAGVAPLAPKAMAAVVTRAAELIRSEPSVTVRNAAVEVLSRYASSGRGAAVKVYPLLKKALWLWEGKHAARALQGLGMVATMVPELAEEVEKLAQPHLADSRSGVRKAAEAVIKSPPSGRSA